jgi:NAD(P)-dependent dehydrogenase (short-subunit alcohol dehydrogenase family)
MVTSTECQAGRIRTPANARGARCAFLTGATGSIGSFLVPELIGAGHHMVGLSRSDAGRRGAHPRRGGGLR